MEGAPVFFQQGSRRPYLAGRPWWRPNSLEALKCQDIAPCARLIEHELIGSPLGFERIRLLPDADIRGEILGVTLCAKQARHGAP